MKLPDQENRVALLADLERIEQRKSDLLQRQEQIAHSPLKRRERIAVTQELDRLNYAESSLRDRLAYTLNPQEQRERDLHEELRPKRPMRERENRLDRDRDDFWDRRR